CACAAVANRVAAMNDEAAARHRCRTAARVSTARTTRAKRSAPSTSARSRRSRRRADRAPERIDLVAVLLHEIELRVVVRHDATPAIDHAEDRHETLLE